MTIQGMLAQQVDTEEMNIGLPLRKFAGVRYRLESRSPGGWKPKVQDVFSFDVELHHGAHVVQPGRYSVHRLLQLVNIHQTMEELRGCGNPRGRIGNIIEVDRMVKFTAEFRVDVGWWRWLIHRNIWK